MGDHDCVGAPESPQAEQETSSSPYALRPTNSNSFQPVQPSPLQFDSPPPVPTPAPMPQTRQRAPTLGSSQPSLRMPRPALPRINADAANKPFLAPFSQTETPISPASSSRSGSSLSNKPPPPLRSMTSPSPRPRIFDPRPPSPELSVNLDCAFPPFPTPFESRSRRPSTSSGRSGRKTPTGSERGASRSSSRQGPRLADLMNEEQNSPLGGPGENASGRINTLPNGPFEPRNRRPSNVESQLQEPKPLDRRRPSSPEDLDDEPPPIPPLSKTESYQMPQPPRSESNPFSIGITSTSPPNFANDKKVPPERPARPTESLTPSLLDTLRTEPVSSISAFPMPSLPRSPERSNTFPLGPAIHDEPETAPTLSRMRSEPEMRGNERRPTLPDAIQSEPSQVPQVFPARGASKNDGRMDYRLQDAPPVPRPVQLHRSASFHRTSGSDASSSSSMNSLRMTNSSGPSPVVSAASSVDVFSPLAQEMDRASEDNGMRVAGLNIRSQVKPGMRAEQSKEKSPPRNFARPVPPRDVSPLVEDSPMIPAATSWPLESPMDPAMKNGKLGDAPQQPEASTSGDNLGPGTAGFDLDFNLSPAAFLSHEYDPYRALTPQAKVEAPPEKPRNDSGSYFKAYNPNTSLRSETPQPTQPPPPPQGRPRSKTESTRARPLQPPPMPHEPPQMQLSRRPTIGGKSNCRGCGLLIEGKSVKAADGNLTGRWHKACFVCKTCERPFPNADFYVLKNNPYCEQHYHEKNGSLCFGCRRGIEGQYLETKSQDHRGLVMRKYHPRCFTCLTCRKLLTDDYFDVQGRVYCEPHAMASTRALPRRAGPGGSLHSRSGGPLSPLGKGLSAERRTTKMGTTR